MKNLKLTTDEGSQILPITMSSSVEEIFDDAHFDEHLRVVVEKARKEALSKKIRSLYVVCTYDRVELKELYFQIINKESILPSALRQWVLMLMTTAGESVIEYYKNKKV